MKGTLIVCATPIGNLGDAPPRLAEALAAADVVYAEDTRRTATLLAALGVEAELRSYFVGNEEARAEEMARRLAEGETIALVSDAGTPAVADPGVSAVRAARGAGATITAVPGPSAVTMALAVSGFGGDRFVFEGFLPRKGHDRSARIGSLAVEERTAVFFSTGPRLVKDLADLAQAGTGDRHIVVARELTKVFEEVWFGLLSGAAEHWEEAVRKGEFTVVLEGIEPRPATEEEALVSVVQRVRGGQRLSDAAKAVARETGLPRSSLYAKAIESISREQD